MAYKTCGYDEIYYQGINAVRECKKARKMANDNEMVLLHWNEKTSNPSVQDPLGLNLRVGARLGAQLLYCITSVTPRARYYSFLTWCISDYIARVKGSPLDNGLRIAVLWRERSLTLGCIFAHNGQACEGGGLIGSTEAARIMSEKRGQFLRLDQLELSKIPAWDVYKSSLAGLDLFTTVGKQEGVDEDAKKLSKTEEEPTEDDLQLSETGQKIADTFEEAVKETKTFHTFTQTRPSTDFNQLEEWGCVAGLCGLAAGRAPELDLLRQLFLQNEGTNSSHRFRHDTLVLLLFLSSKLAPKQIALDASVFSSATYFREVFGFDEQILELSWPKNLVDIASRWQIFHAHYFLSVALEGLFVSVVNQGLNAGLEGFTIDDLLEPVGSNQTAQKLSDQLGCELSENFLSLSPRDIAISLGISLSSNEDSWANALERDVTLNHVLSEVKLESLLRDPEIIHTPKGVALSLLLVAVVTMRFYNWRELFHAKWLKKAINDKTEDITVPLVYSDFKTNYTNWWETPFRDLGKRIIQKFVVRQHENLAYEKSRSGGKILFHTERGRIIGRNIPYEKIGVTNPRFQNAIQIIRDLGWLQKDETGVFSLTHDGQNCLTQELERMEELS